MAYELRGEQILDKMFLVMSLDPNEEATRDYVIPASEKWSILAFGGSSSVSITKVYIAFSCDGGTTWLNPYDGNNTLLRCLNITKENAVYVQFPNGIELEGDGENTILRIGIENYDTVEALGINAWINGIVL
jgi:hypothetical protein